MYEIFLFGISLAEIFQEGSEVRWVMTSVLLEGDLHLHHDLHDLAATDIYSQRVPQGFPVGSAGAPPARASASAHVMYTGMRMCCVWTVCGLYMGCINK